MEWIEFPEYDLLYTDPPWGEGMVKYFETQQRKDTGEAPANGLTLILNKLFTLASTSKPMLVEYGMKGSEIIPRMALEAGHRLFKSIEGIQSNGRPFMIFVFNADITFDPLSKGFDYPYQAVKQTGAKTVFDPFAGIGITAKAVHLAGAEYIGSEINAKRFAKLELIVKLHNGN
jgi:hypothetical protein